MPTKTTIEARRRAHAAVAAALRTGKLTRQPCAVCGDQNAQAHHPDYAKPLDVRWLCASHHASDHAQAMPFKADLAEQVAAFLRDYQNTGTKDSYWFGLCSFFRAAKIATLPQANELTPLQAEAALSELSKTMKHGTVAHVGTCARQFYRHLRRLGLSSNVAVQDMKIPRSSEPPFWNVLGPGEAPKAVAALDKRLDNVADPTLVRDRAVVEALIRQGWRAFELCKLSWGDFSKDFAGSAVEGRVRLRMIGKRGKPSTVIVAQSVIDKARVWAGDRTKPGDPFIARDKEGHRLTRQDIYRIVKRRVEPIVGHPVTPHGLRATYTSRVAEKHGIFEAQKAARHSSIKTTERYLRWVASNVAADDLDL